MDPLSAIASVIAVAQAVSHTLDQVNKFYGAKAEILALMNEVSDLRLVLQELDQTMKDRGQHTSLQNSRVPALLHVLKRAQAELETFNEATRDVFRTDHDTGKDKVSRVVWMRKKSSIIRLQSQLRDMRATLSALCSTVTMSVITSDSPQILRRAYCLTQHQLLGSMYLDCKFRSMDFIFCMVTTCHNFRSTINFWSYLFNSSKDGTAPGICQFPAAMKSLHLSMRTQIAQLQQIQAPMG